LLVQPNYAFRSSSKSPDARRATEAAFPQSVLAVLEVHAGEGDRVIVEITDFVLTDGYGLLEKVNDDEDKIQFELDLKKSLVLYPEGLRGFPQNTEIEVLLTFKAKNAKGAGKAIASVAPTATSLTVRQRHSFIALPDEEYVPRRFDPRAGYFALQYVDFATPLGQPITQRFILRHRLRKVAPYAAVSEAVTPIVYYLDRGTPEFVRQALLEGGNWWNQAFEAAGYRNAFRFELLPAQADPLDVRFNVVQWTPRDTRGWSYAQTVVDPRTGEIMKGHVVLDGLRARYDYLVTEGLLLPYVDDKTIPDEMRQLALARLRQLVAHEIGHALGLRHNFATSAHGRASVMDYPHPLVKVAADGSIDLRDAYTKEIGPWDKIAIAYGYQDFPSDTDEPAELARLIAEANAKGLLFMTDPDAYDSAEGDNAGAHPQVARWDNGPTPTAELERMMDLRGKALTRFGAQAIRPGMPLAALEDAFVPLYLGHRYQVEATAHMLAGVHYTYSLRGDEAEPPQAVAAAEQEHALTALLQTLDPAVLAVPASLLKILPPRPYTYDLTPELFARHTGRTFDALSPPSAAARLTLAALMAPSRAARLVQQHALDPQLPGLEGVLDRIIAATFDYKPHTGYEAEIARSIQQLVVAQLMDMVEDSKAPEKPRMSQVRAIAALKLDQLRRRAEALPPDVNEADRASFFFLATDIHRFQTRQRDASRLPPLLSPPPGAPLGTRE
jgi:hypothetical protein